ncbi:type VI secretion system secreted protein VgrG [Duganella sp. CF458]|uniref:type VI secretion system tip protein TssI/VgrG n=1 Tax=Duganella sp. CF458 TaxID=1884368 RepID=UPI0008E0C732|nr:type VI secretion system tip protein TssI/VgrG [Duganella sp. CF458]SFG49984.1 type VI secretion system secreted protein VgrG [Duganella sp. CF458]
MSFGPLDGKTALASPPLSKAASASALVGKLADTAVPTAVELATHDKLPPAAAQLAQTALSAGIGAAVGSEAPATALAQDTSTLAATGLAEISAAGREAAPAPVQTAAKALQIEEHPLAGLAITDFMAPAPEYAPAVMKPQLAALQQVVDGGPFAAFHEGSRLLRFYSPLEGNNALLVETIQGEARMSSPYLFTLSLLSKSSSIDLQDLLGKNVSVGVRLADGSEHFVNGYVNVFGFTRSDGGFAFYHAEIVPWLAFLQRRTNSRIFQDLSVVDVLTQIFSSEYGSLAAYEFRTAKTYLPENYIVQYDETDEHFVSRLMEKYGLFYYFEHSEEGHVMVISDDSRDSTFCPPQSAHAEIEFNGGNRWHDRDAITAFTARRVLQPTKIALNTFDFKSPNTVQYVELPTASRQGDVPTLEVYDGNPAFSYKDRDSGEREAQLRMEAMEWQAKLFAGESDCRGLAPGHSFKLLGHHWFDVTDEKDNDFLVIGVQLDCRNNFFASDQEDVYRNTFTAIRRKIPYRPVRGHRSPRMPGPQTASVVGPKGQEIHTDQYGRIKVQFHWDRYGRRDEASSCWIRVSQPWAGKGWGTVSIPRIGQEVLIDYLEGDPDRPVCTGRLFNADQPAPYALPAGAHMMGFKSRSTPGGGGFSEMVIHDSKGSELINIHAQKDMLTTVQNAHATTVNGPHQTNTVSQGYQRNTVKQQIEIVSETSYIDLLAKRNIALTAETEHIALTAKKHVEVVAETEHIGATAKKFVELKAETEHIGATAKKHVMLKAETEHVEVGASKFVDIKSDTQHIHLTANTDITLQVGASKIELRADGTITISGKHIDIIGSDRIDLNK